MGAIAAFWVVMFIYFLPTFTQNKVLRQSDNDSGTGMQHEIREYAKKEGKMPLWTNSMFSGMPAYQILYSSKNKLKYPFKAFLLGNNMISPHTLMFLMMLAIYIALIMLGVDWRIGILGAIAFAFSTGFVDQLVGGHSTKLAATAYAAPIIVGILTAFRGRVLLGVTVTAFFLGLQIYANHVQITFYTLIVGMVIGISYMVDAFINGTIKEYFKPALGLVVAVGLAMSTNTGRLWTTYEYGQETIRGVSELNEARSKDSNATGDGGLSKDYAFRWDYAKLETFTLLIPKFMGGHNAKIRTDLFSQQRDSETGKLVRSNQQMAQLVQQGRLDDPYWGDQPGVGGPEYFGVIMMFLFFIGAFLVKGPLKWGLVIAALLCTMFSWGDNFAGFNFLFFDHFPLANKFRAVKMALNVAGVLIVILGLLGLQELFNKDRDKTERSNALMYGGGLTVGLILIAILGSFGMFDMLSSAQKSILMDSSGNIKTGMSDLVDALQSDRGALMRGDAFRSLLFVLSAFGILWFAIKQNWNGLIGIVAVLVLAIIDIFGVANHHLNHETFVPKNAPIAGAQETDANKQIKQDKDPHFRVANYAGNTFNDSFTSLHHKSIGGYHPAKLMRYNEVIETYLYNPNENMNVLSMLNAKYLIGPQGAFPNRNALGNAWFVDSYEIVKDGDAEFLGLKGLDAGKKALIQKSFEAKLGGLKIQKDSTASIRLTNYSPDHMTYESSAKGDQLAVFSEIYYPSEKGWNLYLDGNEV